MYLKIILAHQDYACVARGVSHRAKPHIKHNSKIILNYISTQNQLTKSPKQGKKMLKKPLGIYFLAKLWPS